MLLDYAEIMEEFREYGQAVESYEKLLAISKKQDLSNGHCCPILRGWNVVEKSGDWSAVLRSLEEQRDLVASLDFSII